jgi:chemosensory pili system protein ChpA (sensor histidine kinase/response regulator)
MSEKTSETTDDLSALAWVHEELRRSLEAAHKALRRFVKESEAMGGADVDAVEPSVLRGARAQIHQGVGALELVGLPAAATVLRASESTVQRCVSKPQKLTPLVVDVIERASFALLDYLARMLAGKPVSPLSLFPQYRAVQEAAGAERIHPADLWSVDWQWRDLPVDAHVAPRQPDAATHAELEAQLLTLMRGAQAQQTAAHMSDACAGLGAGARQLQAATLWKLAAAVFEAQAQGLLGFDVFSKRVASRLLGQFRILERGGSEISERLAQDLLFFCAQSASPGDGRKAPRLAAVRQVYALAHHVPTNYTVSNLGRFDPALIVQARKRVVAAKESWSAVAGGELHRLSGLAEQFSLVGDSLKRLFPLGETFAFELQQAVAQTQHAGAAPPAPLAMEVATSLLYVEAALEDADFDHPDQAPRVRRLAERLAAVRSGLAPEPLEAWMEELYRRVSDRQTMGSVVQELRVSLSEAEKLIDKFFRNPADRQVLIPVPNQLSAMRGVLSVLGMDHAAHALLRMRDEVDGLASTEVDPLRVSQAGVFDRLASNLGALGFMIDMLSVQPQLAKSLFAYDAQSGTLNPVMGRSGAQPVLGPRTAAAAVPVEPRLIEQAQVLALAASRQDVPVTEVSRELELLSHEAQVADQPALAATVQLAQEALVNARDEAGVAAARGQLHEALVGFVSTASEAVGIEPEIVAVRAAPGVALPVAAPGLAGDELGHDDEMRAIFLEEAREVLLSAEAARAELEQAPAELAQLTAIRRAFHTLKGSSRMVGLKQFGEAAWACEQVYNTHLAENRAVEAPLLKFTGWALSYLTEWVGDIAEHQPLRHDAATMQAAAERLREREAALPSEVSDIALPLGLPPGLPTAADLELRAPAPAPTPAMPAPEVAFELDLSALDAALLAPSAPIEPAPSALQPLPVPFDAEATVPLPVLTQIEELLPELALDRIDLDLGEAAISRAIEPSVQEPAVADLELDFPPATEPAPGEATVSAGEPEPFSAEEEQVKVVGTLRIGIPLFNIYLNEADELSRRLTVELAEWAMELHRPVGEAPVALAHSLAGSSATVGYSDLSHLSRALEHALMRAQALEQGTPEEARLFVDAAEEIRRMLHQFAAGFLKEAPAPLLARLAEHEVVSLRRLQAATAASEMEAALAPEVPAPVAEHVALMPLEAPIAAEETVRHPVPEAVPRTQLGVPAETAPEVVSTESAFAAMDTRLDALGTTDLKPFATAPAEGGRSAPVLHDLVDAQDDIDAVDAVDAELFPIFEEEAQELLPKLASSLREWARHPTESTHAAACMRVLHTLKGGARLAGAMRLGEMAHRLETRIEHALAHPPVSPADMEALQSRCDGLSHVFEALRHKDAQAYADAASAVGRITRPGPLAAVLSVSAPPPAQVAAPVRAPDSGAALPGRPARGAPAQPEAVPLSTSALPARAPAAIDWSRFAVGGAVAKPIGDRAVGANQSAVRVRAPLLDRLVNQAGEVSVTRARIESGVKQIKGSLADLTDNLERLRQQLREIELQGETQMTSRLEAAKAAAQSFDPLEFDRFTRFQELTRMMAESVNDVATVQRTLQRSLETTEDELVAQARMTRDLQDDLLRTRMVEFEGLSDRLYRVVRQAAKETGKQVRLDIVGGSIEVDRGVLDRMTPSFEHLLRNCVTHGIESPANRIAAGKDSVGSISVTLSHEGNEVGVEFRDDGGGLNLQRIRDRAVAMGLLAQDAQASDAELANLIFMPGFSTADMVTELAGRGVGMDVVRSEVNALGGRVETSTAPSQGTAFKLILPLTTAVTQVVMLRCGDITVAVPSTLVEIVRRAAPEEIDQAYASGTYQLGERTLPFFWLGALLHHSPRGLESSGRTRSVVVVRSAQQRVAVHVDEVLGNQEVVVKNLGPQLSRLPGLAGITLLASGAVALIYNPVALATVYGEAARASTHATLPSGAPLVPFQAAGEPAAAAAPLVLVVDDSLTVRRVTQRLLVREGYRVVLAKDGMEALERLAEERPRIVLSDIEMPRMDGFDLVRNIRNDAALRDLPVIMITSRIAQKHRDYAAELGVDHYLGKPYAEEDLLALIARYTSDASVT